MTTFQLQDVTRFTSRLTLREKKPIKLHFFEPITLDSGNQLQAFVLSGCSSYSMEVMNAMLIDLDHIFINQENTSEMTLVVCNNKTVMNEWYKKRWEGKVAKKVCERFNYFNKPTDDSEVEKYREIVKNEIKLIQI